MVKDIMKSYWSAISKPDLFKPYIESFVADVVIVIVIVNHKCNVV